MKELDKDPRKIERHFSLPMVIDYNGPALVIDDSVILLAKMRHVSGPNIQIFAPSSMSIAQERVLKSDSYLPRATSEIPIRITSLELAVGHSEGRRVTYIGDYRLTYKAKNGDLSYFLLHSPQAIKTREIDRNQDLRRILSQLSHK